MTPLILVTIGVILVAAPLSVVAAAFCWQLWREDRTNRLALVLALKMTAATVAGVLLAIPTVFYIAGVPAPFSGQLILIAIDILLPSSVVLAGYLWWLRRA